MYIVVSGRAERMREVPAYLYHGQHVVAQPVETRFSSSLIVDTGSMDRRIADYLRDRIASGMFGAVVFDSLPEAEAYVKEQQS